MWAAVAVIGSALVGAGAQAYSANKASKATKSAAQNEFQLKQEQFDYQRELNQPFYDEGLPAFRSLASAVNGTIDPATGKTWTPTTSPAFDWQQSQLEKNMGRKLRALGRENSTFGLNAMGDAYNNLYANEYDKQIGRLADMSNIARGGASALSSISDKRTGAIGDYTNGILAGNLIKQQGYNNAIQTGLSGVNAAMGMGLFNQQPINKPPKPANDGYGGEGSYGVLQSDEGYRWGY